MHNLRRSEPGVAYLKSLIESGFDGISHARREVGGRVFTPPLKSAAWTPIAIGAMAGVLGSRMAGNRKPSDMAFGGLIGGLAGLGAAMAWTSRRFTGCAARRAFKQVNDTRDAHWLQSNPIDYA